VSWLIAIKRLFYVIEFLAVYNIQRKVGSQVATTGTASNPAGIIFLEEKAKKVTTAFTHANAPKRRHKG